MPFVLQRACNVLLNAYAQVGQAKQASALFGYMKEQRMRLDAYTYSSVIKALSRDRSRTDEVLALFQEMQVSSPCQIGRFVCNDEDGWSL